VQAAKDAGMQVIQFENSEQLKDALQSLHLL
jgi:hypothetical protein